MGFSTIVSPHKGAAFRAVGAARAGLFVGAPQPRVSLPLHSPALEASPAEELAGRKDFLPFVGSFCAIFVLQDSFCCPR